MAFARRKLRVHNLYHAAPWGQRVGIDVSPHVPHEQRWIEILERCLGLDPALTPDSEAKDDGLKLLACGSKAVFAVSVLPSVCALDHASPFQLFQSLR